MSCNSPVTKNSVDLVERAQWALHVQRKAILICIFTTKKSNHAPTTPRPCTKAGGGGDINWIVHPLRKHFVFISQL